MFSLDMGLLWTYLASMLGVLVAVGLTVGLIAWYTGSRQKPAARGAEEVQAEATSDEGEHARGSAHRRILHGTR